MENLIITVTLIGNYATRGKTKMEDYTVVDETDPKGFIWLRIT